MHVIDLNGAWTLSGGGLAGMRVLIPGGAFSAFDGQDGREPANTSEWIFEREFEADAALLANDVVDLELNGVDTFANVLLNDEKVLETSNVFRRWRCEVKDILRPGANALKVAIRKCDGIPGICRPVFLRGWSGAKICAAGCGQRHGAGGEDGGAVSLLIGGFIEVAGESFEGFTMDFDVTDPAGRLLARRESAALSSESGAFHCEFSIENPELWQPAGTGGQALYGIRGILRDASGNELDRFAKRAGLRTLESDNGVLRCNGKRLFVRGAVWTPPRPSASRIEPEDYEHLLGSAVDANFNALLLSDGGVCESDEFWDLCDEYGLVALGAGDFVSEDDNSDDDSIMPSPAGRACVPDSFAGEPSEQNRLAVFRESVSLPHPSVFGEMFAERRLNINSREIETLFRHGDAATLAGRIFAEWPAPETFGDWCVISQIAAAENLYRAVLEARLAGKASGFVYEPYADNGAAVSASSLDAAGNWKAAHYAVRRAFARTAWLADADAVSGSVVIRRVSDDADSAPVNIRWYAALLATGDVLDEGESACAGGCVSFGFKHLLKNFDAAEIVVWFDLPVEEPENSAGRTPVFFVPPKYLAPENPHFKTDVENAGNDDGTTAFTVTLTAENAALWVRLEVEGTEAVFGNDFFHLEPDDPYEVAVALPQTVTQYEFCKMLKVRSLGW